MTEPNVDIELVERTVAFYQPDNLLELAAMRGTMVGTALPFVTNRNCKVCTHPERIYLENATHAGYDHKLIMAGLHDPDDITWRNVRDHFRNGHVPISKANIIDTLWKKAEEHGVTPEEYTATQMAHVEALDLVVDKFLNRLRDPSVEVDVNEGLKAIQMMHAIQIEGGGAIFDPNDIYVALRLFMNHVQTVLIEYVPDEYRAALSDLRQLLSRDPILRKLIEKGAVEEEESNTMDHQEEETEPQEAEIVHELTAVYRPPADFDDDDEPDPE